MGIKSSIVKGGIKKALKYSVTPIKKEVPLGIQHEVRIIKNAIGAAIADIGAIEESEGIATSKRVARKQIIEKLGPPRKYLKKFNKFFDEKWDESVKLW